MIFSRRDFLKFTSASLALGAGTAAAVISGNSTLRFIASSLAEETAKSERKYFAICDTESINHGKYFGHVFVTDPGCIKVHDVQNHETFAVDAPFWGHIVLQNHARPEQVVAFEKWGKRGALVDIKERKILCEALSSNNKTFFGHATFNADGTLLVTTEDGHDEPAGQLVVRNSQNMKIIDKIDSHGVEPHECRSFDNGKTMMALNSGSTTIKPNLVWIDFASGKLLNRVDFGPSQHVRYSHFDQSHDNWICVSGGRHKNVAQDFFNLIVFISPEGKVIFPKFPEPYNKKLFGEGLSIAILGKTGLVGITIPEMATLLFMDYKTQTLAEAITLEYSPNGILPIGRNENDPGFLVSLADKKMMSVKDIQDKSFTVTREHMNFGGNGSHLSRFYL